MLEFQFLRIAVTTLLWVSQGQPVIVAGQVIIAHRLAASANARTADQSADSSAIVAESKPEPFLWLGMTVEPGNSLLVQHIAANTLGSRNNFRAGDRIVKVEGQPVGSFQTLRAALASQQRPAVLVEVIRDERTFQILVARPQPKTPQNTVAATSVSEPRNTSRALHVSNSAGTLVIASHPALEQSPDGEQVTALSVVYHDSEGKRITLSCEGSAATVRSRLDQVPSELRSSAIRWLGSAGLER